MNNEKKPPLRQIKFRGLRVDGKGWVIGWLFKDMLMGKMCIQQDTYSTMSDTGHKVKEVITREVIPETVGQFTGLLDKNGKEIYEGDIIRRNGHQRIVVFKNGAFCLEGIKKYDGSLDAITVLHHGSAIYNFMPEIEVIGNIHKESEVSNG